MPTPPSDLPHSEEMERAILGAILLDPKLLPSVAAQLKPLDFWIPKHQAIFAAMLAISPLDIRTLQVELERAGAFAAVGGLGYVASLDLDLPRHGLDHVNSYAETIKNLAVKRELLGSAEQLRLAAGNGVSAQVAIESGMAALKSARERLWQAAAPTILMADDLDGWLEEIVAQKPGQVAGPKTNTGVDRFLGAFGFGRFYVLAGDPGTGKTSLAIQIFDDCITQGLPAFFFSNEMAPRELYPRWVAHRFGLNSQAVLDGRIPQPQMDAMVRLMAEMKRQGHIVVRRRGVPWPQLEQELRREHGEKGTKVAFLDHLHLPGLVVGRGRDENPERGVNELANAMAGVAQELGMAFIALAHLSRRSSQERRPPAPSDLRYGGEGPVDGALLIHRPPAPSGDNGEAVRSSKGLLILAKHRHGPEGSVRAIYDGATCRWSDDKEGQ